MTRYLTLEDVLEQVASTGGIVRDIGLLESAVARPKASVFGQDAYATLAEKAAALMHSIAQNQALVDGNKRLALTSTLVLLRLNGARSAASKDELFDLMMDMADGLSDVQKIASRLKVAASDRPSPELVDWIEATGASDQD